MTYRIGYCPSCDAQIMVQDTNGSWNTWKANYANILLQFPDGHLMRMAICKTCAIAPDVAKIMAAVTGDESNAAEKSIKNELKTRGEPTTFEKQQG